MRKAKTKGHQAQHTWSLSPLLPAPPFASTDLKHALWLNVSHERFACSPRRTWDLNWLPSDTLAIIPLAFFTWALRAALSSLSTPPSRKKGRTVEDGVVTTCPGTTDRHNKQIHTMLFIKKEAAHMTPRMPPRRAAAAGRRGCDGSTPGAQRWTRRRRWRGLHLRCGTLGSRSGSHGEGICNTAQWRCL